VSHECTLDAVQIGVRREGSGRVHERERDAHSWRPWRAGGTVRAMAVAGPTVGRGGWQRLGGIDGGQWALMARQQRLACRRSLGLHGRAHGRHRREREREGEVQGLRWLVWGRGAPPGRQLIADWGSEVEGVRDRE
jgi:hypothetical protein